MDWDIVDGLTMVPGLVGVYWLAWSSNDFVYRISVLSWGWTCVCSMAYHFNKCDLRLRKYDQRAQWVSQVFMILETPQSSWPIVLGGMLPVDWKTRTVINGLGMLWFARHKPVAVVLYLLSFVAYLIQFPMKIQWSHSVFHVLIHVAGLVVALDPFKKYTVPIHPDWAWLFFAAGAAFLLPPKELEPYNKYEPNDRSLRAARPSPVG